MWYVKCIFFQWIWRINSHLCITPIRKLNYMYMYWFYINNIERLCIKRLLILVEYCHSEFLDPNNLYKFDRFYQFINNRYTHGHTSPFFSISLFKNGDQKNPLNKIKFTLLIFFSIGLKICSILYFGVFMLKWFF